MPRSAGIAMALGLALPVVVVGAALAAAAPMSPPAAPSPAGKEAPPPSPDELQTPAATPTGQAPSAPAVGTGTPETAPVPPKPPAPPVPPPPKPPAPVAPSPLPSDELADPGYVPGYRAYQGLSLGPAVPRVGALPGGLTPGYAAPMPPSQWTFRWTGFLNDTFQSSIGHRMEALPGQSSTMFHIQPQVVDEYASFLGTSTMPGQWVSLNMQYGTPTVSANLALNTWNPTEPTTYYQIGSQNFVNNAYLEFDVSPIPTLKTRTLAGYFYTIYGGLGQYGLGMYTSPLIGLVRGVGEDMVAEYHLSPTLTLLFEEGFMGNRNGKVPDGVLPDSANSQANPIYPAAYIAHLHAGIVHNGPTTVKAQLHLLTNWAQDDRVQCQNTSDLLPCLDNPTTREVNENFVPDGHITVVGVDASLNHPVWGYLGAAASYASGVDAFVLKGLATFGGEGAPLTDRWWGTATGGTGQLYAAGLNYSASLGRILAAPQPFHTDGPDLLLNAGFEIAYTESNAQSPLGATVPGPLPSDVDLFNHRLRYKAALDGLYTFASWVGAGLRVDRVVPSSKDSTQDFTVLAPRLVFKTNWGTRETITLIYARWFYGPNTHPEASSIVAPDGRLDDQLIALNVNLWW